MLDKSVLKRLSKGAHEKNATFDCIHIKDNHAEITNGTMILREKISDTPLQEQVIDRKSLEPVAKPYPSKVGDILKENQARPSIFKMTFSKEVFATFLKVLPDNVTKIVFEIKGAEHPLVISCDNIEGLLMPMSLEQNGNTNQEPAPGPAPTEKVVKIIIENGEVVAVEGLPDGYKYEVQKKG